MSLPRKDIYEVARQAQVSIATVSRVLNNPQKVSDGTRGRVLATIEELGFVPKAEAAARARKAHGRIGVMAPFFTYPSFTQRLQGVAGALAGSAYELVIYTVDSATRRDTYLRSLALNRRLDGLIVMALPFADDVVQPLRASGLELVLIECRKLSFTSLRIDDHAGGRIAAEHFLMAGYTRCAFVGDTDVPDYAIHTSDARLQGYRAALGEAGVPLPAAYIGLAPHGLEPARLVTHRLLNLPQPPTAIFAASDTQALGVLKAARERGLAVPRQLAVIGFDDLPISAYIGLTTVRQPLEESGRMAVELLLARLANAARPSLALQLPLELVRRDTA